MTSSRSPPCAIESCGSRTARCARSATPAPWPNATAGTSENTRRPDAAVVGAIEVLVTDLRDGPGTSEPTVSIVVPTFHRPRALRETLSRLLALDYDPTRYEVIVVDDGADATTAEIVGGLQGDGVKLTLDAQDRRGAASARNRGARLAGGELLLFIDDDIVVAPDHLQRHRHTREQHAGALVNGSWE